MGPRIDDKPVGCAVMDCDGIIVSVTRSFAQLFGCQSDRFLGQSIFDIFSGVGSPERRNLLREGKVVRVEPPDKRPPLCWSVHRIAPDAILGGYYVGLLYPKSDLESFEHQLAHLDRLALLGGLAAEMAHEIAGPLSVIANNADLLLEEDSLDHDSRRFLITMRDEAYRLGNLLHDFLFVARDAPLKLEALDIVELIEMPVRLIGHQRHLTDVVLEIQAEPNLPKVIGDVERLQQVLFNLIKNACDASPQDGTVRILVSVVAANNEAPMLELAIVDQGEGIDPQEIERIFKPFYSTNPAGQGTGLGLPIARRIVEAHHGELRITSMPGEGTRATVWLPVVCEEAGDFCEGEKFVT